MDANQIMEKLKSYLKNTEDGKNICAVYHLDPNKTTTNVSSITGWWNNWTYREARYVVESFVKGLYIAINSRIPSIPSDFLSITDNNQATDSIFYFGVEFDESMLKRKSLFYTKKNGTIKRTGKGINNVLTLFIHGYRKQPIRNVGGYWEHPDGRVAPSHKIGNRTRRDPDNFIREYINDFYRSYRGQGMSISLLDHKYETHNQ